MRKTIGQPAPSFKVQALSGEEIDLEALRGRPVWLAFFRYASCPLCNLRVHQIVAEIDRFEHKNLKMIGVFQSPREKLDEFVEARKPPFAIVADPSMELYRLYGVESGLKGISTAIPGKMLEAGKAGIPLVRGWDGPPLRIPADFLIDPQGKIEVAFYGENISDHISFDAVEKFIGGIA